MGLLKTAFKWIAIAIGCFIALIFILAASFGFATEIGIFPATLVQTGEEMPEKHYEALRDAKVLERKETVKFYYSEGMFDVTDGGTIMTNSRIIGYWKEDEKIEVLAYPLETLDRIVMNLEGGALEDAEYAVAQRGDDENSLLLFLSVEEDRHLEMVGALEDQIEKNNAAYAETAEETTVAVD